ncbi:MAG: hypothetical protein M1816_002461 [Peltula sp. TS41687]|nr:MAG: hypothetical protein M1816_002461 [Peltula sp. TS41687]
MDIEDVAMRDGLATEDPLEQEITKVREQVRSLRRRRSNLKAAITAVKTAPDIMEGVMTTDSTPPANVSGGGKDPEQANPLPTWSSNRMQEQMKHDQQCLYRMGAGATMFEVKDPDPYAVDDGRVLGVRIEVCVGGRFLPPYYLLLNRPISGSTTLRIHKHTTPPAIPLSALAATYLPQPTSSSMTADRRSAKPPPKQDLSCLVRTLRHELMSYHLRLAFIDSIHESTSTPREGDWEPQEHDHIREVSSTDAEGRELRIDWLDGRTGRVRIGTDGDVCNCVIFGEEGRDRRTEREICGGNRRIEGLSARLGQVSRC